MTLPKRTGILQDFRQAGPTGPRVLIISSVGATGLNLAFANILIQLVSAFEEECMLLSHEFRITIGRDKMTSSYSVGFGGKVKNSPSSDTSLLS